MLENPEVEVPVLETRRTPLNPPTTPTWPSRTRMRCSTTAIPLSAAIPRAISRWSSSCPSAFAEVDDLLTTDGNIRFIVKELPLNCSTNCPRCSDDIQTLYDNPQPIEGDTS